MTKKLQNTKNQWIFLVVLFSATFSNLLAQPAIQWDKTIGGLDNDYLWTAQQTADGGYILGGQSENNSGLTGDRSERSRGRTDYWIVKLSADGTREWEKTYGGDDIDILLSVKQTADGGYILGGYSSSGPSDEKTEGTGGTTNEDNQPDFWIVKVSANGTKQWDRTCPRLGEEQLIEIRETPDGGYMAWGNYYIAKLSGTGQIQWDRYNVHGIGQDSEGDFETSDGGYIVAGPASQGYSIFKLTSGGAVQWSKNYMGAPGFGPFYNRQFGIIKIAPDGGYLIGGSSSYGITGDKTEASRGGSDYWIIKINEDGSKVWDKTLGGGGDDFLRSIDHTSDGGYLLGGSSTSGIGGDKTGAVNGEYDAWMIKISEAGVKEWDNSLGGTGGRNSLTLLQQKQDGNYILSGSASGLGNEDKTGDGSGSWMVKLAPGGTKIWDKVIGSLNYSSVITTNDDGYLVAGASSAPAGATKTEGSRGGLDYWVIKQTGEATTKTFTLSSAALSFNYSPGNATPAQILTVTSATGIPDLTITKIQNSQWLTVEQTSDGNLSFSIDANGLAAGTHNTIVSFFAPDYGRVAVPVQLVVVSEQANNTFLRINAGGNAFVAADGRQFRADQYYSGIDRTSSVSSGDIANTNDDVLYRSGRCSPSFNYNIPVANGTVNVVLHFAETWFGAPGRGPAGAGKRRFHVNIEGSRKLTDYDIYASAGGAMRAITQTFSVTVTDGMLNIDFLTGAADLPRVSAIEVLVTGITLPPVADSYIHRSNSNIAGLGTAPTIEVKNVENSLVQRRSAYLRFSLGTAGPVSSAKLRIYGHNHENSNGIRVHVYGVNDDSWKETTVALYTPPTASTPSLSSVSVNNVDKYYELDVTSYVQAQQQANDALVSFLLADPAFRNTRVIFNSRENASNPPQLVIQTAEQVNSAARLGQEEVTFASEEEKPVVFPNPVKKQFSLSLSTKHAGDISLEMVNLTGRSYNIIPMERALPGQKAEVDISGHSLSTGIYLIKARSAAFSEVHKVFVAD